MTAFDTAWDIMKRYEIHVDKDSFDDVIGFDERDEEGASQTFRLVDTVKNKIAGDFSLDPQNVDNPDNYYEDLTTYFDNIRLPHVDKQSGIADKDRYEHGKEHLFRAALRMTEDYSSPQSAYGRRYSDYQYPILHANMKPQYRNKGLYTNLVIPSLVNELGGVASDISNRSRNADRAHNSFQRKVLPKGPRIRHVKERPLKEFDDWTIFDAITQGLSNQGHSYSLDDVDSYDLYDDVRSIIDEPQWDIYEQRNAGIEFPGETWGDLKPSPRTIPIRFDKERPTPPPPPSKSSQRRLMESGI